MYAHYVLIRIEYKCKNKAKQRNVIKYVKNSLKINVTYVDNISQNHLKWGNCPQCLLLICVYSKVHFICYICQIIAEENYGNEMW